MKKSGIKLITAVVLALVLALSFSIAAFATEVYDCEENGHVFFINEYGEEECSACGILKYKILTFPDIELNNTTSMSAFADMTIVDAEGIVFDENGNAAVVTEVGRPVGSGFMIIGIIVGALLLLPVFLLLLPVFLLLLPVFILLLPVFLIIGVAIIYFIPA